MSTSERRLPGFDARGNLPSGVHTVTPKEMKQRFAWNGTRKRLFDGLSQAAANLRAAGVKRLWIGGSFVTNKDEPRDVDGCWEYSPEVKVERLNQVFLELDPPRQAMKEKYGVDFLISGTLLLDAGGQTVEEFFQFDREGYRRGILLVQLSEER